MKKLNAFVALVFMLVIIVSCSDVEEFYFDETDNTIMILKKNYDSKVGSKFVKFSKHHLIIQYEDNIDPIKKEELLRNYRVFNYEICSCTDGSIEKWYFGKDIDIEEIKKAMRAEGEDDGVENVDNEFYFKKEEQNDDRIELTNSLSYQSFIKPNDGVTIAILDTGIDVNYAGFRIPFLYDATNSQYSMNAKSANQISGWDYVNEDDDANDDYAKIHGTKVSYIIHEKLITDDVPHQMLSIKVANKKGKISAFSLICGMKNATELADIVNLSLGYYSNGEDAKSTIIEDLIIKNKHILFVASAGNKNIDNDSNALKHYPSDYPQENVLAIAAANADGTKKAWFSNYGKKSIDFYAIGEDVKFIEYDSLGEAINTTGISGTSYAAPYVTAVAAKLFFDTPDPVGIIQKLDGIGIPINEDGEKVKYRKIIK